MNFSLLTVSPLYTGILGLILVALTLAVVNKRRKDLIAVGDGGDKEMTKLIRIHGNFTEFVPLAVIMMVILEVNQVDELMLHGLGIALVIGRLLHAAGLKKSLGGSMPRVIGTALTLIVIIVESVYCIGFLF